MASGPTRNAILGYAALAIAVASVILAGGAWWGQSGLAYIDSARLMQEYEGAVNARSEMQKKQKKWRKNIQTLKAEAKALEQSIVKGQVQPSNVEATRDSLQEMRQQLARYQQVG